MPVDPTGTVNSAPSATGTADRARDPSILGKDDFLKLLVGQMQNQDPLNPTDSAQYMSQMTQFSILEQITNLGQTMQAAASNEYDQNAIALIGKEVTYLRVDEDGDLRTYNGRVESVSFTSAGPILRMAGEGEERVLPVSVMHVWGPEGAPDVPPPVGGGEGDDGEGESPEPDDDPAAQGVA